MTASPSLRTLFAAGVDAVAGHTATERALGDALPRGLPSGEWHVAAVGKAADAMLRGALARADARIVRMLVITKHDHLSAELRDDPRCEAIESGHPAPDEHSLAGGTALRRFVTTVPADGHLLVLISGGTSALVEDLVEGVSLDDLRQVTDRLLAGGHAIGVMNQVRRQLSTIKGGRLAALLPDECAVTQLLISDVPGDHPDDIGSGPLIPPGDSPHAVDTLLDELIPSLPSSGRVEAPAADDAVWQRVDTRIIASSAIAQAAVVAEARRLGLAVVQGTGSLDGEVVEVADRMAATLLTDAPAPGLYVWGGEPTLTLPDSPGRGGRNQHLALLMAKRLAAAGDTRTQVLVCGTDGTDGPTGDAGGLVTAATVADGRNRGLDIDAHLAGADSGHYLEAAGALVTTGPTGTNVMDLAIAWVDS